MVKNLTNVSKLGLVILVGFCKSDINVDSIMDVGMFR